MDISKQAAQMRRHFAEERKIQTAKKFSRPSSGLGRNNELISKKKVNDTSGRVSELSQNDQERLFNNSNLLKQ